MDKDSYLGSGERARTPVSEGDSAVKSATQEVARDARRRGQEIVGKAADEAQQVAGRFREQAGGALGEGKTQLAAQIGGVARALKASGSQFREDNLGGLADLSNSLAGQVEAVQRYLGERSSEALLGDLRVFARRRGLFVGSLVVAGLVAAYFTRSGSSGQGRAERLPTGSATTVTPPVTVAPQGTVRTYPRGRS